jgi:ribosomal protein RSM22 (predicted rRNA methylase)
MLQRTRAVVARYGSCCRAQAQARQQQAAAKRPFSSKGSFSFSELTTLDRLTSKPIIADRTQEEEDEEDIDKFLNTGDIDPRYKLGREILRLARVPYRRPEVLPDWVVERKDEISGRRTPAQVRRCLKDWMLKSNRQAQKKYFDRAQTWGENVSASKALKVYPYGPEETVAYSNYFFPGRYSVLKRLLRELQTMLPDFVPRRIVDFGCGPGTGAAVAVDVFGRDVVSKYAGVDMSQSMQDAAQIMTAKLGIDCHFWSKTSDLIKRALTDDFERFDLAICSYTLTELANDPARRAAVQILYELLDCGGVIVFLEKGNPEGSFTVRTARQLLLSLTDPKIFIPHKKKKSYGEKEGGKEDKEEGGKDKEKEAGAVGEPAWVDAAERPQYVLRAPQGMTHLETEMRTLAPCTHDKPCPLSPKYFCSFSQKVFGAMIHDQQAEKYSYAIMQKRKRTVFVKETSEDGASKLVSFPAYLDGRTRTSRKQDPVFEKKLHSRNAGGVWLNEVMDEDKGISGREHEFPTPITVLKRFQNLGDDADQPVDAKARKPVGGGAPGASELDAGQEGEEMEEFDERDMDGEAEDRDLFSAKAAASNRRAGGRKPRAYLARTAQGSDDEEDDYYDEDDDEGGGDSLQFEKPKTKVDLLIDDLIDEVDWEEYDPPLYRREWGRILRTPLKNKGHVIMDLCMPSGEIVRSTFARSNIQPVPQLYRSLRKTSWGGLFPVGAGDEDNFSVLMKEKKSLNTGMSAVRVAKRAEREALLLARAEAAKAPAETAGKGFDIEGAAKRFGREEQQRAGDGRRGSRLGLPGSRSPSDRAVTKKSKAPPDLIPGKDVPRHSTYLRSAEYLNRSKVALMEEEKEESRRQKVDRKRKGLSDMGAAFRKRQEAKRQQEGAGSDEE